MGNTWECATAPLAEAKAAALHARGRDIARSQTSGFRTHVAGATGAEGLARTMGKLGIMKTNDKPKCQDGHVSGIAEAFTGHRVWKSCGNPAVGFTIHQGGERRYLCKTCSGFHPGEKIHPIEEILNPCHASNEGRHDP